LYFFVALQLAPANYGTKADVPCYSSWQRVKQDSFVMPRCRTAKANKLVTIICEKNNPAWNATKESSKQVRPVMVRVNREQNIIPDSGQIVN
jgi:hypothetical protein